MLSRVFHRVAGLSVLQPSWIEGLTVTLVWWGCLIECLMGILNWLFGRMLPLLFDRDARLDVLQGCWIDCLAGVLD